MNTIAELDNGDFLAEIPNNSGRFYWYNRNKDGKVRYLRIAKPDEIKEYRI
jgi:hypothetical protein